MRDIVVVIPTFNEVDNIEIVCRQLFSRSARPANSRLSVLIVDDSSPDGTAKVVRKLMKTYSNLYLISGKRSGLGAAYKRGFKYALARLSADVVMEMDADLSHNPTDLPRLVNALNGKVTFVIGSRYIAGGKIPDDWSRFRKLNSRIGNIFAQKFAGLGRVRDCTGGFRAIEAKVLRKIDLSKIEVSGYVFQIDILKKAIAEGARVAEIPITFTDRAYGSSKLRLEDIGEFFYYILKHTYFLVRDIVSLTLPLPVKSSLLKTKHS